MVHMFAGCQIVRMHRVDLSHRLPGGRPRGGTVRQIQGSAVHKAEPAEVEGASFSGSAATYGAEADGP